MGEAPATALAGSPADIALADLVDRLLTGGVVVSGDLVVTVAEVELARVSLRAVVSSVTSLQDGP